MSSPFIQLYIGDYLRDTQGLSTEGHGAYLLILFAMWNADGWVSADTRKLAQYARMTVTRWAKIAPDILPFLTIEDGMATQNRLLKQLEKASGKSLKRSTAGKLGAQAKALKNKNVVQANANAIATANADGLLKHLPDTRNQIPESKKEVSIAPIGAVSHETKTFDLAALPHFLDRRVRPIRKQPSESETFQAFYAAYPLHKSRSAAAKAYASALSRAAPDTLLAGAERYAASRQNEDPKFTKHPATWLNQDCWLDEDVTNDHRPATKNDSFLLGFAAAAFEADGRAEGGREEPIDCGDVGQTRLALPIPGRHARTG